MSNTNLPSAKQKQAQLENYAIYHLRSMKANLVHIHKAGFNPIALLIIIDAKIAEIKQTQLDRKNQNETKFNG